jgi:hypothetical protein
MIKKRKAEIWPVLCDLLNNCLYDDDFDHYEEWIKEGNEPLEHRVAQVCLLSGFIMELGKALEGLSASFTIDEEGEIEDVKAEFEDVVPVETGPFEGQDECLDDGDDSFEDQGECLDEIITDLVVRLAKEASYGGVETQMKFLRDHGMTDDEILEEIGNKSKENKKKLLNEIKTLREQADRLEALCGLGVENEVGGE